MIMAKWRKYVKYVSNVVAKYESMKILMIINPSNEESCGSAQIMKLEGRERERDAD